MARRANPSLSTYRAKRDFERTEEPRGVAKPAPGHRFVIQKHAARRLHYDFRLELDGVLLSWSVPKGPSLAPADRRLAVRTEDHPLEYADFEGVIPPGQYGGGAVAIWDRGTWEPEGGDAGARRGLAAGRLSFALHGEKLTGRWHLVRTKPQGKQESWLLFKGRDEAAHPTIDITAAQPTSVVSGRTIEAIASARDAKTWKSNRQPKASPAAPLALGSLVGQLVDQLGLDFALTNLDKPLYPEGIVKAQLIAYYAVIAERMLPHVGNRVVMLLRCPGGRTHPCFFQKHAGQGAPDVLERVPLDDEAYLAINDVRGLIAAAQLGALEIHTWGSRIDRVEHPDRVVIDLDPDPALPWDRVALAAFEVRRRLNERGLTSFVSTTGGKGLHVTIPIERRAAWPEVKAWAKTFAEELATDAPDQYLATSTKARRTGRIFVDYLRNGRGATFICPYSTRAREHATVATPIDWEELARGVDPTGFTIASVPPRIARVPDPWAELPAIRQRLR
jgi:bifunctional non-homologous end joining protein LigD